MGQHTIMLAPWLLSAFVALYCPPVFAFVKPPAVALNYELIRARAQRDEKIRTRSNSTLTTSPIPGLIFPTLDLKDRLPPSVQDFAFNLVAFAGEWAFAFADLSPETAVTTVGQLFLATNVAYLISGIALYLEGDSALATCSMTACFISFWYHYAQLQSSSIKASKEVQVALLVDYAVSFATIGLGLAEVADMGISNTPALSLVCGSAAFVFLFAGWFPPFGVPAFRPRWAGSGAPYIFVHSAWHVLSALTIYLIGEGHITYLSAPSTSGTFLNIPMVLIQNWS